MGAGRPTETWTIAFDEAPLDEETVAVPRRRRTAEWTAHLPNGVTVALGDEVLLGRAPQKTTEHPAADLVVIDDPSVSKTHAALRRFNGALQVCDLHSSNGTIMITGEIEQACPAGVWMPLAPGASLELGTAEVSFTSAERREVTQ
jgi:hypothetical protein